MTTQQLLDLDCRYPENQAKVQKALRMIKPLANIPEGTDVPIEKLERCIKAIGTKYGLFVRSLFPDLYAGAKDVIWRSETVSLIEGKSIGNVYGRTLYEVLAKITILLYSKTRNGK